MGVLGTRRHLPRRTGADDFQPVQTEQPGVEQSGGQQFHSHSYNPGKELGGDMGRSGNIAGGVTNPSPNCSLHTVFYHRTRQGYKGKGRVSREFALSRRQSFLR